MTLDATIDVAQREPTIVSRTHYCVVGDVTVDDSAAIAPGVVLQAIPGSRIAIGRGACLAGGVCIQAKAGLLMISAGATLGANVLVVGSGKVGENACVSPGSTLMNPQIADNSLLPPNTLSGASAPAPANNGFSASQNGSGFDASQNAPQSTGRSINSNAGQEAGQNANQNGFSHSRLGQDISTQPLPKNAFVEPGPITAKPVQIPSIDISSPAASYDDSTNGVQLNQPYNPSSNGNQSAVNQSAALAVPSHDRVYGREQVSELISTLFPNRHTNGN